MSNAGLPEPWERQMSETSRAYTAFCLYRDYGVKRSLIKVSTECNCSYDTMAKWSKKYNWVERARQYDDFVEKELRAKKEAERLKMCETHASLAVQMLVKSAQALKAIPADEMTAQDISRMVEVASKLERLSRGEPTESTEVFGKDGATPAVQIYIPSNGREKKEDTPK